MFCPAGCWVVESLGETGETGERMKTVSNLLSCSLHTVRPPRIFLFKINLLIHSGLVNELNWELGQFEGFFLFLKRKKNYGKFIIKN